jgi:hypothetical protein
MHQAVVKAFAREAASQKTADEAASSKALARHRVVKHVVGCSWVTKQIANWGSVCARRITSTFSTQNPTECKMVTAYLFPFPRWIY